MPLLQNLQLPQASANVTLPNGDFMSPQEAQVLQNFLNQLVQARNVQKDPEAESMIANAVARQPDASYLLVQRALLMEQALESAKSQIASLQNQVQAAQGSGHSFLDAANTWGNHPAPVSRPAAMPAQAGYPPAAPYQPQPSTAYPPQYSATPQAAPGFFSGRGGSFLGTAAATAAGVAGGAFLFQGIGNLLGHHGGSGFLDQQHAGALAQPVENTTINNYYNDDNSSSDASAGQNDFSSEIGSDNSADFGSDDDNSII
jgi:hypothetical protein